MKAATKRIVVLGMMAKMPVPGVLWQTLHYLQGLERLGFEAFYVEANARTPSMLMESDSDDGSGRAAALIARVMQRYGLGGQWAYHALHEDGRCYGLSESELRRLYGEAELIINLHGGTEPRPEFGDRLVYLETDPVQLQIELHDGVASTAEFLEAHSAYFTFAENLGQPGCELPLSDRFDFLPTRQPVVLDHWTGARSGGQDLFTTVGNWQQGWRTVSYSGETYGWSKDQQWRKFLDLPARTGERFELALSGFRPHHREQLELKGWRVRCALDFSSDTAAYRDYIAGSRAEFTVAKEQNVRFRSGWFSDRSATYLAAGRPVITQDTAFGCTLPTGDGLYAVSDVDEAAAAVAAVTGDYRRNCRAASEIAREFFDAERVLGDLLGAVGISCAGRAIGAGFAPKATTELLEADVDEPAGRAPGQPVAARSRHAVGPASSVLALIPHFKCEDWLDDCLESLVRQTRPLDGIVVIDDSSERPPAHIVERYPSVTLMHAGENVGPYRLIQQVIEDTRYDAYMFQDADDWSAPDRLELLLEHAGRTGAELIGTQEVRVFCDEPEVAGIEWPLDVNAPFKERPTAFPLLHPTSLVSRDLVMALDGFSSGLRFGGDAEFLRRAHHIARCVNVPAFSYYRRVRQGSLTTAPATAIGTAPRKRVMEMTFARAKRNVELVAAGEPPDLSPCETAPPVSLTRLCGPALRGPGAPTAGPPAQRRRRSEAGSDYSAVPPPRPVFVVGADRSGVTALACALAQHPALAPATGGGVLGALAEQLVATHEGALGEDPSALGVEAPSPERFCAAFGAAASARVAAGSERWVDGSWQNAGREVALAALFPEARFIHIVRGVDSAVTAVADPPLGSAGATGGTQIPVRLRTKLSQGDALARWLDTVRACAGSHEALGDERMLQVTFGELLADPAALVRRCLDFVGEPYGGECLRPLRGLRARMKVEGLRADGDPAERALLERARELSRSLTESGPIVFPPETELPAPAATPTAVAPRPEAQSGTATERPAGDAIPRTVGQVRPALPEGRVVMVTDHFPKVSETFFVRKFLGLRRRGWDVHVVCNRSNREHWEYFPSLRGQMDLSRLHVTRDVEAELTKLKPDLVHFGYGSLARGRMHLRDALGCKMVVSFRGFDINHHGLDDPDCYADVWESADSIHAVSEAIWRRARLRGCPEDHPHAVIADAVDTSWFEPSQTGEPSLATAERPLRILSVGRLHWKKGHAYALSAVRRLVEQGVPVRYRIAGDGDQREALAYDIEDQGLGEHVELTGACAAEAVRQHLEWADVFLHPSLSEAFGVAVLEAQAMAVPVVCSDAGGLPENVVDGETGFVVPARDPAALAASLASLAAEPALVHRMGKAARSRVEAHFSAELQLRQFETLYRSLLATPPETQAAQEIGPPAPDGALEAMRRELGDLQRRTEALRKRLWRREVLDEVHRFVEHQLPTGTTVAVVSRGDERLVDFSRATAWHFPRLEDGTYVGHHPPDSAFAIAHLEHLRSQGARHLVIPGTSLWWLDHYDGFARHLEAHYARIGERPDGFVAYALDQPLVLNGQASLSHASNGKA